MPSPKHVPVSMVVVGVVPLSNKHVETKSSGNVMCCAAAAPKSNHRIHVRMYIYIYIYIYILFSFAFHLLLYILYIYSLGRTIAGHEMLTGMDV